MTVSTIHPAGCVLDHGMTPLPATRALRQLKQIQSVRVLQKSIRLDNEPEMRAGVFTDWCDENDIELAYIQPGEPNQNAEV